MPFKSLFCLTLASLAVFSSAQEKYSLRINAKVGDRFEFASKLSIVGGEQIGKMSIQLYSAQCATKVSDSGTEWSGYIAGGNLWGSGVLAQLSASEGASMKNKSFKVSTSPLNVATMEGGKDTSTILLQSNLMLVYPEAPVAVGDSWVKKVDIMSKSATAKYTLRSVANGIAEIDADLTELESLKSGKLNFKVDLATGMIRAGECNLDVEESGQEVKVKIVLDRLFPVRPRAERDLIK